MAPLQDQQFLHTQQLAGKPGCSLACGSSPLFLPPLLLQPLQGKHHLTVSQAGGQLGDPGTGVFYPFWNYLQVGPNCNELSLLRTLSEDKEEPAFSRKMEGRP